MQLQKLYQSFTGALTTYSSAVQYAYDVAHQNRLASAVYPSGKTLAYSYNAFDNVASINEGTTPLVSYLYDGSGSAMQTTYNQPDISLTYVNGGLDRYGRVVNHSWVKNNGALVHIVHGYDYAGNRLYRNDIVQNSNSELYAYDNLGQIKTLRRGVLNADKTNVPAVNHSEAWNFDKTGNWLGYNKNGMTETRSHNAANELQGIAAHDANGNMTLMPGLKGKYDAWNRLVEVRNADDAVLATYEYNGLNQRIKKTVGGVLTKSFYNENWKEVESVTGSQMTSYVWGVRYIDDLVLREKGEERLYSVADANWNVVALVDTSGAVVERMKYDAFGKVTWLDAGFTAKANSDYGWNRTFTGQVLDSETGLMLYRSRYYHTGLGRFVTRDPVGYEARDVNIYEYVSNYPINNLDYLGLWVFPWDTTASWDLWDTVDLWGNVASDIVDTIAEAICKQLSDPCNKLKHCLSCVGVDIAGFFGGPAGLIGCLGCDGLSTLTTACENGSIFHHTVQDESLKKALSCASRFLPGWKSFKKIFRTPNLKGLGRKRRVQKLGDDVGAIFGGTLGATTAIISAGMSVPECAKDACECSKK